MKYCASKHFRNTSFWKLLCTWWIYKPWKAVGRVRFFSARQTSSAIISRQDVLWFWTSLCFHDYYWNDVALCDLLWQSFNYTSYSYKCCGYFIRNGRGFLQRNHHLFQGLDEHKELHEEQTCSVQYSFHTKYSWILPYLHFLQITDLELNPLFIILCNWLQYSRSFVDSPSRKSSFLQDKALL